MTKTSATPAELSRLAKFIIVSLAVHVAILVLTSLPFIMRGFKPAEVPKAPAAAPAPAAPAAATPPSAAAAAPTAAPATKPPRDADAEYGKDKTATPDELKSGGPSIDAELK